MRYFIFKSNTYTVAKNNLVKQLRELAAKHNLRILNSKAELAEFLSDLAIEIEAAKVDNPRCKDMRARFQDNMADEADREIVIHVSEAFTLTVYRENKSVR